MDGLERNSWMASNFDRPPRDARYDYISRDGKVIVDVQRRSLGVRDIYAAAMNLAVPLSEDSFIRWGCLVTYPYRISRERLLEEWNRLRNAMKPEIASRMALIQVEDEKATVWPPDPYLEQLASAFEEELEPSESHSTASPRFSRGYFEVSKLLICHWLFRKGPVGIGELSRQMGMGHQTVSLALQQLENRGSLVRHRNRSVELSRFPTETWYEILALSDTVRRTKRFADASGQPSTPQMLVRRLARSNLAAVAVGGTIAARYWDDDFDLNGDPRLDIVFDASAPLLLPPSPEARIAMYLDAALKPSNITVPANLVIHSLFRSESLFRQHEKLGVLIADPVETALDLCSLRLDKQAIQLMAKLRPEIHL